MPIHIGRFMQPMRQRIHQQGRRNTDVVALREAIHRDAHKAIGMVHHIIGNACFFRAENQGDRSGETYALQSDLEELASELLSLQNYVQTYFGHIRSENEQWYFTATGGLTGTNNSMTSSSSFSQYMLLVGQSFRTKANSVVSFVKIKLPLGTQPSPDKVFISPYSSTLTTNDFTYADAISTNEAPPGNGVPVCLSCISFAF